MLTDLDKLLADAAGSGIRAADWAIAINEGARLRRKDAENIAGVLTGNVICLAALAKEVVRLRADAATLEKTLELLTSESRPQVVPCGDHPVLDLIARAIAPPFRHGSIRYRHAPAEEVTRESECVTFLDTTTGQRYEIIVRPIDEEMR